MAENQGLVLKAGETAWKEGGELSQSRAPRPSPLLDIRCNYNIYAPRLLRPIHLQRKSSVPCLHQRARACKHEIKRKALLHLVNMIEVKAKSF